MTFREALAELAEAGRSGQSDVWLNYISTTNERGAAVVAKIREFVPSLRGRRLLDVGSGYGGVCIAAAQAGAEALGIEVDERQRGLAALNLADFPGLAASFRDVDAMDWASLATLGRFDVVVCDNVIEHVTNPRVLLAHARRLLQPDGLVYLTAPNAFSFGQITRESHYGQFGLSLLDALDGEDWVRQVLDAPSYGVSVYLRLAEYEDLLSRYGLHARLVNALADDDQIVDRVREARRQIVGAREAAALPACLRAKVDRFLDLQLACCDADLEFVDAMPPSPARSRFTRRLQHVYLDELWYVVASPARRRIRGPRRPVGEQLRRVALAIAARAARVRRAARRPPQRRSATTK